MILSYNARTTHVYRDGAVVGRVEKLGAQLSFIAFRFDAAPLTAPTLTELLALVRKELAAPDVTG